METLIVSVFIIGYLAIIFEPIISINKSAIALVTGVLCWVVYILWSGNNTFVAAQFATHFTDLSGILFFLIGAMTIVELIDAHNGFDVISAIISTNNKVKLLWIVCLFTFFLSAVLDNLTTTIVLITLLRKLIADKKDRLLFVGMVIIAANCGGAWSPIGDITTTMLWVGGQISAKNIVSHLFLPSLISLLVPLLIVSLKLSGNTNKIVVKPKFTNALFERNLVFIIGIGALLFVPVFKSITQLPAFMGMLFGLGVLWIITELIHNKKEQDEKNTLSVVAALQKIDVPSILFFLGILIAVAALQATGLLTQVAHFLNTHIGNLNIIVSIIGVLSAFIDNVPLVAATMGMYDINTYPQDSYLWEFIAYCAGTGGSILIIGSAAGVTAMGMEKIDFMWYLKNITWLALISYFAGIVCYMCLYKA